MQSLAASEHRHREIPKAQRYFVRPSFEAAITLIGEVFGEGEKTLRLKSRRPEVSWGQVWKYNLTLHDLSR